MCSSLPPPPCVRTHTLIAGSRSRLFGISLSSCPYPPTWKLNLDLLWVSFCGWRCSSMYLDTKVVLCLCTSFPFFVPVRGKTVVPYNTSKHVVCFIGGRTRSFGALSVFEVVFCVFGRFVCVCVCNRMSFGGFRSCALDDWWKEE